ncbi:MAG: hypothetical protein HY842_17200 [Bacteroidetes bacterium]|nr:hypothetical protein [Bacteroidota bacterium]
MENVFEKIKQSISHAGESLKEQAVSMGEAAKEQVVSMGEAVKEKGYQIIEHWVSTLPKLEAYGFKTTYFSLSASLNPTLEIELQSAHDAFPLGRVEAILAENGGGTPIHFVFTTIKTTLQLHQKARIEPMNPLTVKIRVRLSPEIRVSFGNPILE